MNINYLKKLNNKIIKVSNNKINKLVQYKLFELGFEWCNYEHSKYLHPYVWDDECVGDFKYYKLDCKNDCIVLDSGWITEVCKIEVNKNYKYISDGYKNCKNIHYKEILKIKTPEKTLQKIIKQYQELKEETRCIEKNADRAYTRIKDLYDFLVMDRRKEDNFFEMLKIDLDNISKLVRKDNRIKELKDNLCEEK